MMERRFFLGGIEKRYGVISTNDGKPLPGVCEWFFQINEKNAWLTEKMSVLTLNFTDNLTALDIPVYDEENLVERKCKM